MSNIFITTTGATPSIILRDLGERILTHPLINYNIGTEFKYQELIESSDFSSALDNAYLTMTYNGILATSSNGTLPLSSSLTASYIIIGNSNNLSYPREIGGDMSLSSTGSLMVNSDSITDGKIISHTSSKISIAAKSQLNSNISYTDQSNTFGTFSQSFKSSNLYLSNPANTFNYQFVGSGITSTMSVTLPLLTSNDTFVFTNSPQTLLNKIFTIGSISSSTVSSSIILSSTISGATISSSTILSSNNIVDATRLQTFTVSTNSPTASNILSWNGTSWTPTAISGDITITNGNAQINTNTIIDADILSHTSSKITIANKSQLNSNIVYVDQANTFGTFSQLFKSSNLYLSNPANTFNYQFVGSGITSTMSVTLPLLTSNDTFVFQSFSQSMTNKTLLSTNNNVIDATRLQTFTVSTATPSNNNMLSYNGSSWAPVKSTILLGYNTGTSSTLVNSVAESNFTSNGFSYSIAPNTLNVNSILRIAAYGKFSTKNGGVGSLTIRLKIGSVTYNTNALTTLSSAVTNAGIRIDGQFQFRSIGSSGTVHSHLIVNPSGVASVLTTSNGTASVDTTISNSVQLSAQWSTADVLNNIQLEQITFELLN